MYYGGFQHIDMDKYLQDSGPRPLQLPCDPDGRYLRQVFTNNGRTATIYVLQHCIDFGEDGVLLMPDYLCLSCIVAAQAPGVKCRYYRVNRDLSIDLEDLKRQLTPDVKALYVIQYFGAPYDRETVEELKRIREARQIPIIEDITQNLLTAGDGSRIGFGDYLVSSTRKWLPMTDGGIAAARDGAPFPEVPLGDPFNEAAYTQLLISLMRDYFDQHPEKSTKEYIRLEQNANKTRYTDLSVRAMTPFSRNVMLAYDLAACSAKRRENYQHLYQALQPVEGVEILSKPLDAEGNHVPFGLVILSENRDALYDFLAERKIIGEIQWILPLEYYDPGEDARYLSDRNIMLQVDDRYSTADMDYIAGCIAEFFRK